MSLASALMEYAVHNDPLGILLIDFDEFKSVNDTFGHACGDRALQQTALTLVGSLRPADTVGRWGGDEFLAIVRNVNGEVLRGLGQRAVAMIKKTSIPSNDERMIPMSISVGAALSRPDETVDQFLRRADELLYRSKGGGRGCVTAD
jgi:diguanylate cyclase (GGDEF)-like protein